MTFLRKTDAAKPELNETVLLSEKPGAALCQPIQAEEAKEVSSLLKLWRWRRFPKATPLRHFVGRNPCDYPLAIHILLRPAHWTAATDPSELLRSASWRNAVQTDEEVLEARGSVQ